MPERKILAIIQARMGSTRLPGKILADIAGKPMLSRVVERARRASSLDGVLVATTTNAEDDTTERLCAERGYRWTRGHPTDVLDRYYQAAGKAAVDIIVRLTADCPMIDPTVIDQVVDAFLAADPPVDFAANRLPDDRTFPIGLDTEVCTFAALAQAWAEANKPYQREHVMPYLYEMPGRFRTLLVRSPRDLSHLRWTVDTPEDLELARRIYAHFGGRDDFAWGDVLALVERDPSLSAINAHLPRPSLGAKP
jgi:spore coat polysaccharide biosynthesis protein SpsF